jgi:hypothetical protein
MPFLHNQFLSRGTGGGTAGGVFTFGGAEFPTFAAFTNDSSSHSLLLSSPQTSVSDFAYWTATPSGSAFWDSGYTIEVWCWVSLLTLLDGARHQNIIRLGDSVNNYGQAIGIMNLASGYMTMSAWHTSQGNDGEEERIYDNIVLPYETWHHFCIERGAVEVIGGVNKMRFSYYINGTQRYSAYVTATEYQSTPVAGNYKFSDTSITLGKGAPGPSTDVTGFRGYINNCRISTGVRYGSSFTPSPTQSKDANTWFLAQLNNNYATE